MVFSSPTFVCLFLPLTLALYFLLPKSMNNALLVAASLVFYAWGDPVAALALIIPSVVLNFYFGRMVGASDGGRRRMVVVAAIAFNLAVLIAFKYTRFLLGNLNDVLLAAGAPRLRLPNIPLPLGISFFTFHILSYPIDLYRGALSPEKSCAIPALYEDHF